MADLHALSISMVRPAPSAMVRPSTKCDNHAGMLHKAPFSPLAAAYHTPGNVPKVPDNISLGTSECLRWEGGSEPHS